MAGRSSLRPSASAISTSRRSTCSSSDSAAAPVGHRRGPRGPVQRNQHQSLGQFLLGAAFFTWREALLGFIVGTVTGILLAAAFVHFRVVERAFVPYVIATQTIPIVALAPIIVVSLGRGTVSVVLIAAYLPSSP